MTDEQLFVCQAAIAETCQLLRERRNLSVTFYEVQQALVSRLELADSTLLPEQDLSATTMFAVLESHSFPCVLETLTINFTALPSGMLARLDEQRRKFKGETWEVHKCDADPWPSNPHAHNVETGYKIDLRNGDIYSPRVKRENALVRRMPRKNFVRLRGCFSIDLPPVS